MVLDSLFGDYKWVNTMHIAVGPLLALIAYLAYSLHFEKKYTNYEDLIKGLLIAQIVIGIVVTIYHSHRLAQKNNIY
tara:strand:+ start:273 stop:503 length:231 start_codon:yes stop_codon:yes gene_type:complete